MAYREMKRADDEQLLNMIADRGRGYSAAEIARGVGLSRERVRTATNRVREADLRESGEAADTVDAAYWGRS